MNDAFSNLTKFVLVGWILCRERRRGGLAAIRGRMCWLYFMLSSYLRSSIDQRDVVIEIPVQESFFVFFCDTGDVTLRDESLAFGMDMCRVLRWERGFDVWN